MEKPKNYYYPAIFTYEEGKEIAVIFPDLCVATNGETEQEAFTMAKELLGCVMYGLEEDGEEIPVPSSLKDIAISDNECAVLVEVFMPSIRMAQINKSVNRTVTLPAWLNALALEKDVNFSQILQDSLREKLNVGSIGR
ncbi:MAG: type II toxin-antitoxin system HicB family antitoxin [Lachnospiraceae bacterium]|nr:type II toxin-antitoxin system HicB family antitoxin [Lachnospiraceae bacterium]